MICIFIQVYKGPVTKDVQARRGGGGEIMTNSDMGGGGASGVSEFKKIQKQISFSLSFPL